MTKLYTKGGDAGRTSLIGGERVPKYDPRVEAYGTVDELTAFLALLGDKMAASEGCRKYVEDLHRFNSALMSVEALLAVGKGGRDKVAPLPEQTISSIESRIDDLQSKIKPITSFTIPGGCETVSLCHVCRTVCRRAERCAVRAADETGAIDTTALIFLNRLSDYLYALGRVLTEQFEIEEILWRP